MPGSGTELGRPGTGRARRRAAVAVLAGLALAGAAHGQAPPEAPVAPDWRTPAEAAGYEATPSYAETLAYLARLAARLPELSLESFGVSPQGRPLTVAILSKERAFTPAAARATGKPIVLIENGIHAGEIDGKDACLELLRDLALGRQRELLDAATLLVVPVYNVDGHERVSPWNRPNQDGPVRGMGFRTTADGHDLNRDWLKLETPEARALVGLVNRWRPHLDVDVHVTDGVDLAWVFTYGLAEAPRLPAPVDAWLQARWPGVVAALERAGHGAGPYVSLVAEADPAQGIDSRVGEPRFSTGYFPLRNRPVVLVETHARKPYRQRVAAVRAFLGALLEDLRASGPALVAAVEEAERATVARGRPDAPPSEVVVAWRAAEPERVRVPFSDWTVERSSATGRDFLRFRPGTGRALEVPWLRRDVPAVALPRPRGYLVLPGWPAIESRLADHGLVVERLPEGRELEVETMRLSGPVFAARPYQGRTRVTPEVLRARERRALPAGTLWVPADQPDFEVAVQLLEPEAPDSLLAWGFLSTVFENKEYIDTWRLEDFALRALADPAVAAEWSRALEDEAFAADSRARYLWWFRRTPHWDRTVGELPVLRALEAPARP